MTERELTFTQVRDGIVSALKRAFPEANVFSERTLQGINNGDFNVAYVVADEREQLGDRRVYAVTFDVIYYCNSDSVTDDSMRVSQDLPLILGTIKTPSGAVVHVQNNVAPTPHDDDTLHTVVQYAYHVTAKRVTVDDDGREVTETDLMRRLQLHIPKEDANGKTFPMRNSSPSNRSR